MMLTLADIAALSPAEAKALVPKVLLAMAAYPPVKRRGHVKDKTREPDVRTAFEDPYVLERIRLQMIYSDLEARYADTDDSRGLHAQPTSDDGGLKERIAGGPS